jgi:Outer membrane lipoprotein carrier protein LolA-like
MTKVKCLLLLVAFALPASGAEPSWGLSELMIDLGRVKQAKGTFVEKKYLKLLSAPLESSGQLNYTAPFRLEKITLTPKPESMVVDQDTLTIEMRGRKRSLQIQDYPVLWAFVESIRGTLKGDLSALQQFYKVKLEGTRQTWQLQLQPTEKKMAALIQSIVIGGSKDRVNSIDITEADGDHSVMTVTGDVATSAVRESIDFAKSRMNTHS